MDLLQELIDQYERYDTPRSRVTIHEPRVGLFLSWESANDLVNQVLQENRASVDAVAAGQISSITIPKRFGGVTGVEAVRDEDDDIPPLRKTYGVRVRIESAPTRKRGYAVRTAYPYNQDAKRRAGYEYDED